MTRFTYKDLQDAVNSLNSQEYLPEGYTFKVNREYSGYRLSVVDTSNREIGRALLDANTTASKAWDYFIPRLDILAVSAWETYIYNISNTVTYTESRKDYMVRLETLVDTVNNAYILRIDSYSVGTRIYTESIYPHVLARVIVATLGL